MKPRPVISALAVLLATASSLACAERKERPGIPARHLLLVTVAGLRADHTSAWQYYRPTTYTEIDGGLRRSGRALALDDLGAEGVLFANTFAPSGDPARSVASLLTGQVPLRSRDELASAEAGEGLAQLFRGAGFATAAFVSEGSLDGDEWARGFDVFQRGSGDRETLGHALDWAGARDFGNGQGVFLWVHLEGPAFPFEPTEMDATIERGGRVDFASLFTDPSYDGPADGSEAFRARSLAPGAAPLSIADRERIVALYDGEISQTDRLLQLFFDFYRYTGERDALWERTFLAIAGVGGLELFEARAEDPNAWGGTGRLTDGVLRVPLVLRHPDSLTGRRIFAHVTELPDLYATLADWAGARAFGERKGRSLLRITDEVGEGFVRRPAFGMRVRDDRLEALTVRDRRWRLVWTPEGELPVELIDQVADPLAQSDLSEEHPEVVADLLQLLRDWLREHPPQGVDVGAFVSG